MSRCTKSVPDGAGGWEACNEPALTGHTCYDHAKTCLTPGCEEPRDWDRSFCQGCSCETCAHQLEELRVVGPDHRNVDQVSEC